MSPPCLPCILHTRPGQVAACCYRAQSGSHLFIPVRAARHAHEGVADDLHLVHAILLAQAVVLSVRVHAWGKGGMRIRSR